jgi:hypothetical protein
MPDDFHGHALKVHAIAFLRGRGPWALIENTAARTIQLQKDKPSNIRYVEQQFYGEDGVETIFLPTKSIQWVKSWYLYDHITRILYPAKRPPSSDTASVSTPSLTIDYDITNTTTATISDNMTWDHDYLNFDITTAIQQWAKLYSYSNTNIVADAILSCLDGLTPTLADCHKKEEAKPLAIIDLSINYTNGKPEGLKPLSSYSLRDIEDRHSYLKMFEKRRLLRYGGAKQLIQIATGTCCKTMVKNTADNLLEIPRASIASNMITITSTHLKKSSIFGTAKTDLIYARPFLETLTIDHRVRFMKFAIDREPSISWKHVFIEHLVLIFKSFNVTKLLDKIELQHDLYTGKKAGDIPGKVYLEPFHCLTDTASMMAQAEKMAENPTPRQAKLFPNGVVAGNWQTLQELHDDIQRKFTKYKTLGEGKRIDWHEQIQQIHGARSGGIRTLVARTKSTIAKWGKKQNHCVATYADRMAAGEQAIFSVWRGNELLYCVRLLRILTPEDASPEITDIPKFTWQLVEFRGQKNKWPEAEDACAVINILNKAHVKTDGWGKNNGFGLSKAENWDEKLQNLMKYAEEPQLRQDPIKNFTRQTMLR